MKDLFDMPDCNPVGINIESKPSEFGLHSRSREEREPNTHRFYSEDGVFPFEPELEAEYSDNKNKVRLQNNRVRVYGSVRSCRASVRISLHVGSPLMLLSLKQSGKGSKRGFGRDRELYPFSIHEP